MFTNAFSLLARNRGHDVVHTRELPLKNETADIQIIRLSVAQDRIVITKSCFASENQFQTSLKFLMTHIDWIIIYHCMIMGTMWRIPYS
ncbi:DUF5615 family PIN-like protein [Membranicola marinus]|uniref:DUF5615 family PIN-like protein n=1 Tax=Membranihabitans marinus TaxID=1227546 RepID=A0A953L7B9_9BACT|nr:DUF5615 family PIN-like protein [Membranihabitans marinus]